MKFSILGFFSTVAAGAFLSGCNGAQTYTATVELANQHLLLRSDFDLSGRNCGGQAGQLETVTLVLNDQNTGLDAFDAGFALETPDCPYDSGLVATFHYNRALTGADIFEIEVAFASGHMGPTGYVPPDEQVWDLSRLN